MTPQFSLNILFKHDQEHLKGLMNALTDWCETHQDTELQFFDLGSNDDSRGMIEAWAAQRQIPVPVKIVDVMDFSHFSQAVGLALRLSVGQVAWVGTPEDFPKNEELEKIFGRWNEGMEVIWGFKPQPMSSGLFEPLLKRVERNYPQSFADQFFEQGRGAFVVADRKVMITHNSLLTSTSSWWRHVVTAGWSMQKWALRNPISSTSRINAPNTKLIDVLELWLNQGSKPLRQILYSFLILGLITGGFAVSALVAGVMGIQIKPIANSMAVLAALGLSLQFLSTSFLFLYLSRRWDRSQTLEKPLRYQENELISTGPATFRGHSAIVESTSVTSIAKATKSKTAASLASSVVASVKAKVETHAPSTAQVSTSPAPTVISVTPEPSVAKPEPVAQAVAPATEETPAPSSSTQVFIMEIKSKSS